MGRPTVSGVTLDQSMRSLGGPLGSTDAPVGPNQVGLRAGRESWVMRFMEGYGPRQIFRTCEFESSQGSHAFSQYGDCRRVRKTS